MTEKTLCLAFIRLGMPSDFVIVETPSGLMPEYFNLRLETFGFICPGLIFEYVAFIFSRIGFCTPDAASEEEVAVDPLDEP